MAVSLLLKRFKTFRFRLKNDPGRLFKALCSVSKLNVLSDTKLPNDTGRVSIGFPSRDREVNFVSLPNDSGRPVRLLFAIIRVPRSRSPNDSGSEVSLFGARFKLVMSESEPNDSGSAVSLLLSIYKLERSESEPNDSGRDCSDI